MMVGLLVGFILKSGVCFGCVVVFCLFGFLGGIKFFFYVCCWLLVGVFLVCKRF